MVTTHCKGHSSVGLFAFKPFVELEQPYVYTIHLGKRQSIIKSSKQHREVATDVNTAAWFQQLTENYHPVRSTTFPLFEFLILLMKLSLVIQVTLKV